jgi:riboflavin biosynthesis pyrimidine reductase
MELRRLIPDAGSATPEEALGHLGLAALAPSDRPYVVANMVSTLDGRAAVNGRSAPMSGAADRALFHVLRTQVDAVMAGAGTMRTERYGPMVPKAEHRARREALGLAARPVAVTVTRTLGLPADLPLLGDPDSTLLVFATVPGPAPPCAATVRVEHLDPTDAGMGVVMRRLRAGHGVRSLLCEGGPHLLGSLVCAGVLDELFLSLSPLLAGGDEAPRITAGEPPAEPVALELVGALEHEGSLFLRYRVDR